MANGKATTALQRHPFYRQSDVNRFIASFNEERQKLQELGDRSYGLLPDDDTDEYSQQLSEAMEPADELMHRFFLDIREDLQASEQLFLWNGAPLWESFRNLQNEYVRLLDIQTDINHRQRSQTYLNLRLRDVFLNGAWALYEILPPHIRFHPDIVTLWSGWVEEILAMNEPINDMRILHERFRLLLGVPRLWEDADDGPIDARWLYTHPDADPFENRMGEIADILTGKSVVTQGAARAVMGEETFRRTTWPVRGILTHYDALQEFAVGDYSGIVRGDELKEAIRSLPFENPSIYEQLMLIRHLYALGFTDSIESLIHTIEQASKNKIAPRPSMALIDTSFASVITRDIYKALEDMYRTHTDTVTIRTTTRPVRGGKPQHMILKVHSWDEKVNAYFESDARGWGYMEKFREVMRYVFEAAAKLGAPTYYLTRTEFIRLYSRTAKGMTDNARHAQNEADVLTAFISMLQATIVEGQIPKPGKDGGFERYPPRPLISTMLLKIDYDEQGKVVGWLFKTGEPQTIMFAEHSSPHAVGFLPKQPLTLSEGTLHPFFEGLIAELSKDLKAHTKKRRSTKRIDASELYRAAYSTVRKLTPKQRNRVINDAQRIAQSIVQREYDADERRFIIFQAMYKKQGRGVTLDYIIFVEYRDEKAFLNVGENGKAVPDFAESIKTRNGPRPFCKISKSACGVAKARPLKSKTDNR